MASPNRSRRDLRPLSPGRRMIYGWAAAVLILLAIEIGAQVFARLAHTIPPPTWYRFSPTAGWLPRANGVDLAWQPEPRLYDRLGLPLEDAPQVVGRRRPRVVGLGDSTMAGFGVAAGNTYLEHLDRRFPEFDCINLAVPGYSSVNGLQRLRHDVLALDPALLVIGFNYEDRRWVLDPAQSDNPASFARIARADRWRTLLRRVYLLQFLAGLMAKADLVPANPPPPPAFADLGELYPRVNPQMYQFNLAQMVTIARQNDIAVVFMLTGDNPDATRFLRRGWRLQQGGESTDAIDAYRSAISLGNEFSPLARLHMAELIGDNVEARALRTLAKPAYSLTGGLPIVRDDVYQTQMRQVALDFTIPVVDLADALLERPELYLDSRHLNADAHIIAADLLADTLELSGLRERLGTQASAPSE